MNYLFTLCGRAGSKGVRSKNLRELCGVPIAWLSLAAILLYKEKYLGAEDTVDIVINTDSEALISLVNEQKDAEVFPIRRDDSLATDTAPKVAVIMDCLERAEKHFGRKYDVVTDLDLTSPLRKAEDVKAAVDKKLNRDDTDVVYSAVPSRRNPYFNMVKKDGEFYRRGIESEFTARQQAPVFYDMNASIYAYSPTALRTKSPITFFSDGCDMILMEDTAVLDIDSEQDFKFMEIIGDYLFHNAEGYKDVYERALRLKK